MGQSFFPNRAQATLRERHRGSKAHSGNHCKFEYICGRNYRWRDGKVIPWSDGSVRWSGRDQKRNDQAYQTVNQFKAEKKSSYKIFYLLISQTSLVFPYAHKVKIDWKNIIEEVGGSNSKVVTRGALVSSASVIVLPYDPLNDRVLLV